MNFLRTFFSKKSGIGIFLFSMVAGQQGFGQSWYDVGNRSLTIMNYGSRSLAVNKEGNPYLVLNDRNNSKAFVLKFDGHTWDTVGISDFSQGAAYNCSIVVDNEDIPYVVFQDSVYGFRPTVMKFTGGSWVTVGNPGFAPDTITTIYNPSVKVNYTDIAIDKNGTPYIAYANARDGNRAVVMKFNGSSWVTVGNTPVSDGAASFLSLAIDNSGAPYVAFQDRAHGNKARVMKFDGSRWISLGGGTISTDSAQYTTIVVDNNGVPYVAYTDGNYNNRVKVLKYDGTQWEIVGTPIVLQPGEGNYAQIALSHENIPYVIYGDVGRIMVKRYLGYGWVDIGGNVAGMGQAGENCYYPSLVIDGSGVPYVTYYFTPRSNYLYRFWNVVVKRYGVPTGIGHLGSRRNGNLSLFPNPNKGSFVLQGFVGAQNSEVYISITDVSGRTVYHTSLPTRDGKVNKKINISSVAAKGIYLIRVDAGNFHQTFPAMLE